MKMAERPDLSRSAGSAGFWCGGAVVALIGVAAALLLHGGGSYYFGGADSDLVSQFYPWRVFVKRWLDRGVIPLWDPHVFGGYPVLETQQMFALNPIRLLFTFLLTPRISLLAEATGYVAIAALGSWISLRRFMRCSAPAAMVGTVVYVFGGLFTIRVGAGHFTVLAGLCWWPLAMGLAFNLARALRPRFQPFGLGALIRNSWGNSTSRNAVLLLGVVNAMALLAGGPQYVVYLFWMELLVVAAVSRVRIAAMIASGFAWAIALCLSAPQWLPTLSYLPFSGRGESGSSSMLGPAVMDLMVIGLETLMPHPLGDDLAQPHLYEKAAWETCLYPGTLALVLTCVLLWRTAGNLGRLGIVGVKRQMASPPRMLMDASAVAPSDERQLEEQQPLQSRELSYAMARRLLCAILIFLGLYLMMGWWLPGFASFREPIKARAIVALGMAWAAAVEFHTLLQLWKHFRRRRLRICIPYVTAAAIIAACALWFWWRASQPGWFEQLLRRFPNPFDPTASKFFGAVLANPELGSRPFAHAAAWTVMFAIATGAGVLVAIASRRAAHGIAVVALLALCCGDLGASHWIAFYARHEFEKVELQPVIRNALRTRLAESSSRKEVPWRVMLPPQAANQSHHVEGLFETGGYDPLMPARANSRVVIEPLVPEGGIRPPMDLVHTAIGRRVDCSGYFDSVDSPATSSPCHRVAGRGQIVDVERKVTIGVPGRAETFGPRTDNLNYVAQGTAEWLSGEPPEVGAEVRKQVAAIHVLPTAPDGHGTVAGETLDVSGPSAPHLMRLHTKLKAPALLVYRTTWLPGWKVKVDDGPWNTALCANRWMVSTILDAGEHQVEFRYTPVGLRFSLLLAALAWPGLLTMLALNALFSEALRRKVISPT
ncbi:MAG: hypothetical protein ACR2IE_05510 [Candidatus Sumerlaeaceae bacterium]